MWLKSKLVLCGFSLIISGGSLAKTLHFIDLTHPLPKFEQSESNPIEPELTRPWFDSVPIPGFYNQAILAAPSVWATNEGHFDSTFLTVHEHHGTHLDASNHYINLPSSTDSGQGSRERKATHQLSLKELTGKTVVIDISERVENELAKNGGQPSPNPAVTDFSDNSRNSVGAKDIEAIADQIDDGVWLILNLGWSQFYLVGDADWGSSPYVNAWNHPGLTKAGVDKLIEIMEQKEVKIAGIAAHNLSVDSGESSVGSDHNWEDEDWPNSWPAHVRLLQRTILLVENLANVDARSTASKTQDCSIAVGALKHVGGTGAPARVMAVCQ